jgi:voltage-gated potassium channel
MELVFLDVLRAIWALRKDRGFVVLALTAVVLVVGGSAFYWVWEDLSSLNAVYLSVMTLATVGYGDIRPETDAGKIFTMFYVIMGIGVLLAFLSAIAGQLRRQSLWHRPLARLSARREEVAEEAELLSAAAANGGYDVLVIGVDEASREMALAAAKLGLRVVVVEEGHIHASSGADSAISPMRPA